LKLLKTLLTRKVASVLLCVLVIAGLIAQVVPVSASPADTVTITPSASYVLPGSTVSVSLMINNVTSISAWQANVHYDNTVLTFVNFTYGNFFTGGSTVSSSTGNDAAAGTVHDLNQYLQTGAQAAQTGASLVTINFTVNAGAAIGPTTVQFANYGAITPKLIDDLANVIADATYTNATINVASVLPPTVSGINPTTAYQGESVVITGSNFTGASAVSFGASAAASYTVNSATQITAVVGAGATGAVTVTTAGGTATGPTFTYTAATAGAVAPNTNVSPATLMTVTGRGLKNATLVTFKNGAATVGTAIPASTSISNLTVNVPNLGASIATVTVVITTPDGAITATGTFNYISASITSLSPATGYTGDTIVINGTGFAGATAVKFGSTNAASFTVNSNGTSISAVVAGGASGTVTVVLPGNVNVVSTVSFVYETVNVSVAPVSQTVADGGTFSTTVNVNTKPNTSADNVNKAIRGWQATITFNPSRVQVSSVAAGTFLETFVANLPVGSTTGSVQSPMAPVIDNVNGTITVSYAVAGALDGTGVALGATGSGVLLTVNFTAVPGAPGTSGINLTNLILVDTNTNRVAGVNNIPGSITLSGSGISITKGADVPVDSNLGAQLTFIAPVSISGWNLVVSANNNVQRTMNVFANASWQVSVQDTSITAGFLTKYNGTTYTPAVKLSHPLTITSDSGNGGTGALVSLNLGGVLATGTAAGQNVANGGDIRNIMLNQPVAYTDPIVGSPFTYHIVLTFTASNTSY